MHISNSDGRSYADVAEKTSTRLPSFRTHRHAEKIALRIPAIPRLIPIPSRRYRTTIAMTGMIEASTVPTRSAALAIPTSGYSAIFVPN